MSTYEDLRADAEREMLLDRCEALHADYLDPECSGCEARLDQMLADGEWVKVDERYYTATDEDAGLQMSAYQRPGGQWDWSVEGREGRMNGVEGPTFSDDGLAPDLYTALLAVETSAYRAARS
jgi:hypothetical protein